VSYPGQRWLVGLLAQKSSTVVDRCSPVTPIDHPSAGAARLGTPEGCFPSVMQLGAAQRRGVEAGSPGPRSRGTRSVLRQEGHDAYALRFEVLPEPARERLRALASAQPLD
jgi:hypothetical protein